ncbi:uncharacterized protein [Dysidea avara]|uniref:uncharacterized protein isoform X2 n=1 Tax=Dysidea avara TaxID=196820 RepID=UPI00332D2D39
MTSINNNLKRGLEHLILTGVELADRELGSGAFGRTFAVQHNGITCAAKELHPGPLSSNKAEFLKQVFLQQCLLYSNLVHPNVMKLLGVYYPSKQTVLPVLVTELMEYSLTVFLESYPDVIPMFVKLSILQDVSRGVHYLHVQEMIHCNLHSNNVVLTNNLVAKICDFMAVKVIGTHGRMEKRKAFVSPEVLGMDNFYGRSTASDVFSFGCIMCHMITQRWPEPFFYTEIPYPGTGIDLSEIEKRQHYIGQISDESLKQLVISCLNDRPEKRPPISQVSKWITSIVSSHYLDDSSIKVAFSLAMKEGVAQSRDLQLLLVGAENTGKTCLISSFLGEEFIEGQSATEGIDTGVCKIYCKNWTKISHSDRVDILHHQFIDQCRIDAVKKMMPLNPVKTKALSYSGYVASESAPPPAAIHKDVPEPRPQDMQVGFANRSQMYNPDCLNLSLWDFPGQIIYHNTHSVFISQSGVVTITFNASVKLMDVIVPRATSSPPPECHTNISSIHYWIQVVDSMCSVEGTEVDLSPLHPPIILAGTHIDKLHPDIKVARKIAKEMILPQLIEELADKPYAQHLVGMGEGIEDALNQFCFFISNKCRDEEIERLKSVAVKAATSLRIKQPIFFLKIERAFLQHKEQVISKSHMADVIAESTFSIAENSSEFEGVLKYFHEKRVILYFSEVKSLKNLVILSPRWLAKLFSYIMTAYSYKRGKGFDESWKRLTEYGILHESLIQHMLDKFHSDYPSTIEIAKQQVVDILLHFHLIARITKEAWFSEEGYPSLPESGDTFIVPSLVLNCNAGRHPPNTKQERIIYFKFSSGFVPISLLNQLIADCICRNVEKNSRLLRIRHGLVELQLGAHQKYYISRCVEKESIQLTITMPLRNDLDCAEERKELISDIKMMLDKIMKVFMPAVKKRPVLLVPCPKCTKLHITLDEVYYGNTIFCSASGETDQLVGYYRDLLSTGLDDSTTVAGIERKLEVFTKHYASLINVLPIKNLSKYFVSEGIISFEDDEAIQQARGQSEASSLVLRKIATSLKIGQAKSFDTFLSIMERHGNMATDELANQMRGQLMQYIS